MFSNWKQRGLAVAVRGFRHVGVELWGDLKGRVMETECIVEGHASKEINCVMPCLYIFLKKSAFTNKMCRNFSIFNRLYLNKCTGI